MSTKRVFLSIADKIKEGMSKDDRDSIFEYIGNTPPIRIIDAAGKSVHNFIMNWFWETLKKRNDERNGG